MVESEEWERSGPRTTPPKSCGWPSREEARQYAFELPTVLREIEVTNGNVGHAV